MKIYKVTEECISCNACEEVASANFEMGSGIAIIKKQPENIDEENKCEEALDICPVSAIEHVEVQEDENKEENKEQNANQPILGNSNVKEVLDKHPELKEILTDFSDKFSKLLNPVMYNTLARFASFNDAAKATGISICEILHLLNAEIGAIDKLQKSAPECIKDSSISKVVSYSREINWDESDERYIYNNDSMLELIEKVSKLKGQENIVFISVKEPIELINTIEGLGYYQNIESTREYRISIFNPSKKEEDVNWKERKDNFEKLDVRTMQTDPFDIIIQKSYATAENDGFVLIQRFEPFPIINMLTEMGFEYVTEHKSDSEIWVYLYKTPVVDDGETVASNKTEVVIQSATPVAYPVIMRLLQSEKIRKNIAIKELKVWEETEKHLAWITNGKADISFSALITSIKLQSADIKIPALFVWDNFVVLTRKNATGFKDLIGEDIHTPLFEEAPPAKITKYLIKANNLNPDDFNFVYGKPFGRPEKIYSDFVDGTADTVILREPEASYALKIMQDRGEHVSILSYNEIWNEVNPGFGSFPNAGLVFKGDFVRKNPELANVFLEELKSAINWVNNHKIEAAKLSFDMMRQPTDRIELFLDRVNFNYVSGDELVVKVKDYFDVLVKEKVIDKELDEEYYDIFRM
ncbi:MAG: DUF1858 domain-containing protein [Ichthyobacteriaceae bacterium]|nr:DUF1858 domain-containing protein [Ichthyobacteriaceae bacterium]